MIFSTQENCRGFSVCLALLEAGDSLNHPNGSLEHQSVFIYYGDVTATSNGTSKNLIVGQFNDVSDFSGSSIVYSTTNGVKGLAIIPQTIGQKYNIDLLPVGTTNITASTPQCVLLCLDKTITCNSKNLSPLQFARILNGNSAIIDIPERSIAALLTA